MFKDVMECIVLSQIISIQSHIFTVEVYIMLSIFLYYTTIFSSLTGEPFGFFEVQSITEVIFTVAALSFYIHGYLYQYWPTQHY